METSNDNDSQKEEGELSDDDNEPENFPNGVQSVLKREADEFHFGNRNFDTRHRGNTVWQNLSYRHQPPNIMPNYPLNSPSTWDYNHGMGTLRYDRIRPMATPPPPQKWDPRDNRPRLPNNRPLLPTPSPRMRNYQNSSNYRNQPIQRVQQTNKHCILSYTCMYSMNNYIQLHIQLQML